MTPREFNNTIRRINARLVRMVETFGHDYGDYLTITEHIADHTYGTSKLFTTRFNKDGVLQISYSTKGLDDLTRTSKMLGVIDRETENAAVGKALSRARKDLIENPPFGPQRIPAEGVYYKEDLVQRAKMIAYVKHWIKEAQTQFYLGDESEASSSQEVSELEELYRRPGFGKGKGVTYEEWYNKLVPVVNKYLK